MYNGLMSTGVYQILNLINGKKYIGSAAVSFKNRWKTHRTDLKRNKHHSSKLQNAWNKYGESNFKFEILEYCEPEDCIKREQWYFDKYKPEYNICKFAGSCFGVKIPENMEIRRKMNEKYPFFKDHPELRYNKQNLS